MKRVWFLLGAASFLIFTSQPVWANRCPSLIKEARNLLPKAKLAKVDEDKVKTLLDESQKFHDTGSHSEAIKKANEALGLLKKKKD